MNAQTNVSTHNKNYFKIMNTYILILEVFNMLICTGCAS